MKFNFFLFLDVGVVCEEMKTYRHRFLGRIRILGFVIRGWEDLVVLGLWGGWSGGCGRFGGCRIWRRDGGRGGGKGGMGLLLDRFGLLGWLRL